MPNPRRDRSTTSKRLRALVLQRDAHACRLRLPGCTGYATEIDHLVPIAIGGSETDPTNCVAACRTCNRQKGTRILAPRPHIAPKWGRPASS